MPAWKIPAHLHSTADAILRELVSRPHNRKRLQRGDSHLYCCLCGAAARMALGPLPNHKQRLALRRWKKQREWEEVLLTYGDPVTLEKPDPFLPLPGRPYWRVSRGMDYDPSWAIRRTGQPPGRPRKQRSPAQSPRRIAKRRIRVIPPGSRLAGT